MRRCEMETGRFDSVDIMECEGIFYDAFHTDDLERAGSESHGAHGHDGECTPPFSVLQSRKRDLGRRKRAQRRSSGRVAEEV